MCIRDRRYSTNLLRVIDRALAVRPEQRFRDVTEMQAGLSGVQDEESDETVIMAPLSKSTKPPTLDLAPLRAALEGANRDELKITRPPTASRRLPVQRPGEPQPLLKKSADASRRQLWGVLSSGAGRIAELAALIIKKSADAPRRQLWGVLSGGAGLAALAAIVLWLWPSAPVPEVKPPRYSLEQNGQPAETSPATLPAPAAGETPTLPSTTAVTPPPVPGVDTALPPATTETPLPMAPPAATALVPPVLDPESSTPAPPVMHTEHTEAEPAPNDQTTQPVQPAAPPADTNDRTAQPVQPAFTPEDSLKPTMVNPVETPLAPALAPTETKPRSGATTEPATAKQDEGKKPTARNRNTVENRSRTSRQKSRRDRTQSQPIIVTPTAPDRVRPAAPPRNLSLIHISTGSVWRATGCGCRICLRCRPIRSNSGTHSGGGTTGCGGTASGYS